MSAPTESTVRELLELHVRISGDAPSRLVLLNQLLSGAESPAHARTVLSVMFDQALAAFALDLIARAESAAPPGDVCLDTVWRVQRDDGPLTISLVAEMRALGASAQLIDQALTTTADWGALDDQALLARVEDSWRPLMAAIQTPSFQAWAALQAVLSEALRLPEVQANPEAAAFAEKCLRMTLQATGTTTTDKALASVAQDVKRRETQRAARSRYAVNDAAKAYVLQAWAARPAGAKKDPFAKRMAAEVLQRFNLSVTPERIADHWLKKSR